MLRPTKQILAQQLQIIALKLRSHMHTEAIPDLLHVVLEIIQQSVGKTILLGLFNRIQHRLHGLGHQVVATGLMRPAIHRVGQKLATEYVARLQEYRRWFHRRIQHTARVSVEHQVMGATIGHGKHKGVAITAPTPANPLQVIGLRRRHRTQQHAGQITDIDTHFQRWCGREQVIFPGLFPLDKTLLNPVTFPGSQQAGMLMGDHPVDGPMAIQVAIQ